MYTLAIIAMLSVGNNQTDLSHFQHRMLYEECVVEQAKAVERLNQIGKMKGATLQVQAVICSKTN